MEAVYIYLIKSSGLIAMFYLAYYFMLRKETFFTSNRWFLLFGLFTAVVLPLVIFTEIIIVEPSPNTIDWSKIAVTTSPESEAIGINWYLICGIIYGIGIVVFGTKFAFDFYSLYRVLRGKGVQNQADFKLIDTTENLAPFSFFNTIVYNSSLYSSSELENILEHEKVHSEQNHTVDVLISRLFCILFWFNPFIWLHKKAIIQNLEFIADSEATKKTSDKKAYQLTLLKITTHENCVAITNHFYQSLIKKRIVMLNKNQSKKSNSWKYAVVIPALVAFVLFFQINVVAQERTPLETTKNLQKENDQSVDIYKIAKNTTDQDLKEKSSNLNENYGIIATFSGITRNAINELISIKVDLKKGKEIDQKMEIKGTEAINGFGIVVSKNEKGMLMVRFGSDETTSNQPNMRVVPNAPTVSEKEIFINGKKVSKEELDRTDPNDITTMDVIKENDKSTIRIITKGKTAENASMFNSKVQANNVILENVDPISISILQKPKNPYTITKTTTETNGIPGDAEYFIDGKKVSPLEAESMNPNHISSVNVQKEGASTKNAIRIITKSYLNGKEMIPEPPTPPTAPTFKSKAPKVDPDKKDNQGWGISFETSAPEDNITRIQNDKNVDYKKAIIIINGKISDYKSLDKLKPEDIFSVGAQKPSNGPESTKQNALKKYGEKAINGIIEIETKDFQKK